FRTLKPMRECRIGCCGFCAYQSPTGLIRQWERKLRQIQRVIGASTGPRLLDYLFSVRLTSGLKAPPSPPSENATACGDQARQSSTKDGSRHRHGARRVYAYRPGEMCLINAVADYVEDLRD